MKDISDEFMLAMRAKTKAYTLVILRPGPKRHEPGADKIIWEHGRRNHALRADGVLCVVCPVGDETVAGVGLFDAPREEVERLMQEDPAIQAGVLTHELHGCWSFPGDALR